MVLLTGTPLQNNLSELYALLHFLDHSSFPSLDDWERRFGGCATRKDAEKLNEAMRPFVLRRMKADVEKSVPPKEETVVHVELTAVQKQWCDGTLLGHGSHSHTATQLSHPAPPSTTGTARSTSATSPSSRWRGGRRRPQNHGGNHRGNLGGDHGGNVVETMVETMVETRVETMVEMWWKPA